MIFLFPHSFATELARGSLDFNTDVIRAILTADEPNLGQEVHADVIEIDAGNGYTTGGVDVSAVLSVVGDVASVSADDPVWTAAGGTIGPFRGIVFYNDTASGKPLIGRYDYGKEITLADGEQLTVRIDAELFKIARVS